jgi:uncharacterized damage-inducible protein DinB
MAEDNQTLDTFYENWKLYQDHLKEALTPLTAEQLALRSAPHLRSIDQLASHIIGVRIGWFTYTLGENADEVGPGEDWGGKDAPAHSAVELVQGLDASWKMMADRLARWSSADMLTTFDDEDDQGNHFQISRSWVIWHLIEHDLHHGGEISLTLGIHGLQAPDI